MNILVYGAGVIGSVYALRLSEQGNHITVLARGQRLADLRAHGVILEEAQTGRRSVGYVGFTDRLAPTDVYDAILVAVRLDQLASVLPELAANRQTPTILFLVNNPTGTPALLHTLHPQRVVLGFPGIGGTRQGEVVRYLQLAQQPTTLGEVDGYLTPRLEQLATILRRAGFSVALSRHMDAWLQTHAVFIACVAAAIISERGDSRRLGQSYQSVGRMVQAIREGFAALQASGIPITPVNLKLLFSWMPRWFAVRYWQHAFQTPLGTLALAPHTNAAREEMGLVGAGALALVHASSVPTPTLDQAVAVLTTGKEQGEQARS